MRKRSGLKATKTPIPSTLNIKTCEHGIPLKIHCSKCNPHTEQHGDVEKCPHGVPKTGEFFCYDCREIEYSRKRELIEKDRYRKLVDNQEESMKSFNVPKKYLESSFETFTGNEKLVKDCLDYKSGGLVLYGNTGCGKTHLAISIMKNVHKSDLIEIINKTWDLNYYYEPKRQIFKPVPDLLMEIRGSFKDNSDESEEKIIEKYSNVPLLVLDDLGSEKTSDFSITTLYIIIDRRDRELMSTIITTNLNPKEIEEKLGARIASRLSGMKNIKINMPDYRKKRG